MARYALKVEYDGTPFHGWQRQEAGLPTVQGAIEAALGAIEPAPVTIAGAGRTDTGVHASGQVATMDLAKEWAPFKLMEALNHHLKPLPVAVTAAARVEPDFHARFSAIGRRYTYRILTRRAPAVFERTLVWRIGYGIDIDVMREAARFLIGNHDFTTFRAVICQAKSPVKSLDDIDVIRAGNEVHLHFAARSFLHNQVRSITGTLERVGAGKWRPEDVKAALEARDRAACGPVAPPAGLMLTGVVYPQDPFDAAD